MSNNSININLASLFFSSLLLIIVSFAASDSAAQEAFLQCLNQRSLPNEPISGAIYTPNNSSFPTVLQTLIRNLRFNETTTRKPFLIITALHVSHIQASIFCAKSHGLQMKIRSGGHDYEGVSYVSDVPFFILDLFNFRSIDVNIEEETAWVQVGAMLGELYYSIYNKSRVHGFPAGVCPTVGVGGHFGGGGYGNMMRKYGLSVDNIADAQIVDVNGRVLDRAAMGEELFWAITGGGGSSFGVVLAYKIKLVRVPPVVTVFRVSKTYCQNATYLVRRWQEIADKIDHDIFMRMTIDVINDTTNGQKKTIRSTFLTLFLGDSARLLSLMNKSFPELGLQQSDCIEMSWAESVVYYASFPVGTPVEALLSRIPQVLSRMKRKSDYLKRPMPIDGIEFIFKKMVELETPVLSFNPYGGRMAEISPSAKPFPHRAGNIAKIMYGTNWDEDGAHADEHYLNLTKALFGYMTPFVSENPREAFLNYRDFDIGINRNGEHKYQNYLEGSVYGIKYFKKNFDRLVRAKTMVDPDNFFRNEQSIPVFPLKEDSLFLSSLDFLPGLAYI